MHNEEATSLHAFGDRGPGEAQATQLIPAHDAVLPIGEVCDLVIIGGWGTLRDHMST